MSHFIALILLTSFQYVPLQQKNQNEFTLFDNESMVSISAEKDYTRNALEKRAAKSIEKTVLKAWNNKANN